MSKRSLLFTFGSFALVAALAIWYQTRFSFDFPSPLAPTAPSTDKTYENDVLSRVSPELKQLFPDPNDWRRVSANVVVPSRREVVFLFRDEPQMSPDRTRLTLNACTTIFLPSTPGLSEAERCRQALVFETSDRVVLTFSKSLADFSSFDSGQFDFSSFDSGEMQGPVVLRSAMKSPKPDDDVFLQTRDVVFTAKQIRTNFDATFRFGRNGGKGKGLTIDLDVPLRFDRRDDATDSTARPETDDDWERRFETIAAAGNVGGGFSLDQIELNELVGYFRFYWNESRSDATAPDASDPSTSADAAAPYVEIRCKNGVYFAANPDAIGGWCVRFNKDVEAVTYRGGEKASQLRCDVLYLYLQDVELEALAAERPEIASKALSGTSSGLLSRLRPTFVRAQRSPDEQASVKFSDAGSELRADEILFDVRARKLDLSSASPEEPVRVSDGADLNFFANVVSLQLDANNRLESLYAGKDGVLETVFRDKDAGADDVGKRFQAIWKEGLRVAPESGRPDVLRTSTIGAVSFTLEGVGTFCAREADFWGRLGGDGAATNASDDAATVDSGLASRFSKLVPLGAAFRGDVSFQAENGTAKISDSVEIRFGSPGASGPASPESAANDGAPSGSETSNDGTFLSSVSALGTPSDSSFSLDCRKLDLWCLLESASKERSVGGLDVYSLKASGGVSLVERSKTDGTEQTRIVAESAVLDAPGTNRARVRLVGSTASLKMKELLLVGYDVAVDCAENSFRVVGPGKLALAPPEQTVRELQKNAELARFFSSDPAEIVWSKATTFDGKTLRFEAEPGKNVTISQRTQTISCPQVKLTLKNPVSIFELGARSAQNGDVLKNRLDVELVECVGDYERPVRIDATSFGNAADGASARPDGEYYRAVFQNLVYRRATGEFEATGGGSLRATLLGSRGESLFAGKFGATGGATESASSNAPATGDAAPRWTRLHLTFRNKATGSLTKREILATGGVRAIGRQTNDPDSPLDADLDAAASDAPNDKSARLSADEALVKFGDPRRNADGASGSDSSVGALELEARRNVVFYYRDVVGLCDKIRYVSEKDLAILYGDGANKAAFYRQEYAGAERVSLGEYTRALVHLKTTDAEIENFGAVGE